MNQKRELLTELLEARSGQKNQLQNIHTLVVYVYVFLLFLSLFVVVFVGVLRLFIKVVSRFLLPGMLHRGETFGGAHFPLQHHHASFDQPRGEGTWLLAKFCALRT